MRTHHPEQRTDPTGAAGPSPPRAPVAARKAAEALAAAASAGDVQSAEALVGLFGPCLARWTSYAARCLPWEERDDLFAEVRAAFLRLVAKFNPGRGVFFLRYVERMLPLRVRHFVRDELRRREDCALFAELGEAGDEGDGTAEHLFEWGGCSSLLTLC